MKKINNIFVPTDFSVTAQNAYHYAIQLAETLGATITVVHVNETILPGAGSIVTPIAELEISSLTQESMEQFIGDKGAVREPVQMNYQVKSLVLRGNVTDSLVALSKAEDTDMMVIGTTGLQDFVTKLTGSISQDLANQAHCPVIMVPRDTSWHKIDKIMYASNYDSATPAMIEEVAGIARALKATIHFVHIQDAASNSSSEKVDISWNELFPSADPGHGFEIHTIVGNDVIGELSAYAEKHEIHMMAFVSKHRSFWQNLWHTSVTENIALSTNTPLMVIHLDDLETVSKDV